ncbi:hypothetical protein niasHT_013146 [Heterodera trifolii]|uniref:Uncharacterized protein n=1 Tax=Heterodera trifolii TaxID=157864 RepID=A0ABD2L8P1_9BILA
MYAQQNDMQISAQGDDVLPLTAADFAAMDEAHRQREVERRQREEQQQRELENRPKWMWSDEWMARQRAWEEEMKERERDKDQWERTKSDEEKQWAERNDAIRKEERKEKKNESNDPFHYTFKWEELKEKEKLFFGK